MASACSSSRGGGTTGWWADRGPLPGRADLELDSQAVGNLLPEPVLAGRDGDGGRQLGARTRRPDEQQAGGNREGDAMARPARSAQHLQGLMCTGTARTR